MAVNLVEGIQKEMNRCRELIKLYEEIGPSGIFGKVMIAADISEGEAAIASGDCIRMLEAYTSLKGCE